MLIIESKDIQQKDNQKGLCHITETDPEKIYDEIEKLMYDCPILNLVSIKITPNDIKEFIQSQNTKLKIGITKSRYYGETEFNLIKEKQ